MDLGRDVAIHPGLKAVGLGHIGDGLGAGEEQPPPHVGGDIAHELPTEAGDFVVIEGCEATEEQGPEGEVDNELVHHAGNKEGSSFAGAHKFHSCAGVGG